MNTEVHPNEEWNAEDESWLQDRIGMLDRTIGTGRIEEWERNAILDYRRVASSRNGQIVRLLVSHPFQEDEWKIIGPAQPGFYHLACRFQLYGQYNGFEQIFHQDEFTSQPV